MSTAGSPGRGRTASQTPISYTNTNTNTNILNTDNDLNLNSEIPDNSFQLIEPLPIKVSSTNNNNNNNTTQHKNTLQYSLANLNIFQNLPRETLRGCDDLTRMEMSLNSNIIDEMKWALKKYLTYSNKAPYMISLKTLPHLLNYFKRFIINLMPIIDQFNDTIPDSIKDDLQMGITSLLILRNLAQDMESVQILTKDSDVKQFLLFVLVKFNKDHDKTFFKNYPFLNEILHYTMDLMEAISTYIAPAKKDDPFFQNLISILNRTKDRALIISILRSLSRLLVRSKEDEESAADNLDDETLSTIVNSLLISVDSELIITSFDFLYQYCLPGNRRIEKLLNNKKRFKVFQAILPEYLTYNVKTPNYSQINTREVKLTKRLRPPPPKQPPTLTPGLFEDLLKLKEHERSTAWLRCCFEPVIDQEYTQIQLWKSYEATFAKAVHEKGEKLGPAVEFIKNVPHAFPDAAAMVIVDPVTEQKRFVIKGIQPRHKALSISQGRVLAKWTKTSTESKFIKENKNTEKACQEKLPELTFPTNLSDVSKVTCTFLCLISNDSKGKGLEVCQVIKPLVIHQLADIPMLNTTLSEYMDNTPNI